MSPDYRTLHKDDLIHLEPVRGADTCIVWLHGLGASMTDLLPVATALSLPSSPHMLLPQAPMRAVTVNGGASMPAWYDILYIGPDRLDEDPHGLQTSAAFLDTLLAAHVPHIPSTRIVLAGFSQGGALALYTGLGHPTGFAGLLVLSGYLPPAAMRLSVWQRPAVLHLHGRYDEVVPMAYAKQGYTQVQKAGCAARWQEYPVGHTIAPDALTTLQQWLCTHLPTAAPSRNGT